MTWAEHETVYCETVNSLDKLSIESEHSSWADACRARDNYEMGYEEGNTCPVKCARYGNKYYVLYDV